MTKRYREPVDVQLDVADPDRPPVAFTWRGGRYRVLGVLGHWREDAAWWTGGGIEVPQRDLWRVEAQRSRGAPPHTRDRGADRSLPLRGSLPSTPRNGSPARGVYELVAEGGGWRLDRVWD
jgi:hypothetical protein